MKPALAGMKGAFVYQHHYDGTRVRTWIWVTLWSIVIGLLVFGMVYGIIEACRAGGAAACRTFASQSGYSTHYKIQHWGDSGTCYVHLPNGHTLPQKMVIAYVKAAK